MVKPKGHGWSNIFRYFITSHGKDKASGKTEQGYGDYIGSSFHDAAGLLHITRQHWGIENNLHWMLNVCFDVDAIQKRAGYAAQNFSFINRIVLNLLKNESSKQLSMKKKRLAAGWDHQYLEKLLFS